MVDQLFIGGARLHGNLPKEHFYCLNLGFHLLAIFWILNTFFPDQGLTITKISVSSVLLSSVFCFALQIISRRKTVLIIRFDRISTILITLLLLWALVTIIRGFIGSDTSRWFTLVANPQVGGLIWLLPFAVYIGRRPGWINVLMPTFRLHAIIGTLLGIYAMIDLFYFGTPANNCPYLVGFRLIYALPFLLLTGLGTKGEYRIYFLCLFIAFVVNLLILQSRISIVMILFVLLLSIALGHTKDRNKSWFRIISFWILFFIFMFFSFDYILMRLSHEWFVDTRTFLWVEISEDLNLVDWIIGRGALGTYYSPYFNWTTSQNLPGDWMIRQVIEIGYLHVVLKAGLIGAFLYFLIVLRAAYKALFKSGTRFKLGVGLVLLMHLLEMAGRGWPVYFFMPRNVLFWLLVGGMLSQMRSPYARAVE